MKCERPSGQVVKHGSASAVCIQCMALPNLPSLVPHPPKACFISGHRIRGKLKDAFHWSLLLQVLRSTDDRLFEPEFFGSVTGVGEGYEMPSDNLNVGGTYSIQHIRQAFLQSISLVLADFYDTFAAE
jgi:hypothetical protein